MALCGETAALFILKSMNYGLKVTDAVICLLIASFPLKLPVLSLLSTMFGPNWSELYKLLSPICHHSSPVSEIKLLEKTRVISQFVYFIHFRMMQHWDKGKGKKRDNFQTENCQEEVS